MRAFVTGASGFIGARLADFLLEQGWDVRALVHRTPLPRPERIEVIRGDIRDPRPWKDALRETDVLFHLAASLGASRLSEAEFIGTNAGATETLIREALDAGVPRIVHVSSAGVIGAVRAGETADETYPLNPRNAYDRSKHEAEKIALRVASEGKDVIIVRPGWAYGPGDRRTLKLIRSICRRRFIPVSPNRGRQTPVFIDDLARGILLAGEKGRAGEVYHLTGDELLTVGTMAAAIAEACGVRIPPFSLPLAPMKAAAWIMGKAWDLFGREAPLNPSRLSFFAHPKALSSEKARRELGFRPAVDFKTGMARTVAWYRAQGWI
jgi:nucleoside-diphosphate-sugar epimerase